MSNAKKYEEAATLWTGLMREAGRRVISHEDTLYTYSDGAWTPGAETSDAEARYFLRQACAASGLAYGEKSGAAWRTLIASEPTDSVTMDAVPMLACSNGTFHLNTNEFSAHDPQDYCTRYVPIEYDPEAACPEWLEALDRCLEGSDEAEATKGLLQEFFGMALFDKRLLSRDLRKALFLYGPSGTGKSSVGDTLRGMFDPRRVCTSTVNQICTHFGGSDLVGAHAWICDEAVSSTKRFEANAMKRILNGEPIAAHRKYHTTLNMRYGGCVLFTSNDPPLADDHSDAVYKRLMTVRFTRTFSATEAKRFGAGVDVFMRETGEYPGILTWALEGAKRAIERGDFPKVSSVVSDRMEFRRQTSSVVDFLMSCTEYDPKYVNHVRTVGVMCALYANREHNDRVSVMQATRQVASQLKSVHPGVSLSEQKSVGGGAKSRLASGLKLNDEGLRWLELAKTEGAFLGGETAKANIRAL